MKHLFIALLFIVSSCATKREIFTYPAKLPLSFSDEWCKKYDSLYGPPKLFDTSLMYDTLKRVGNGTQVLENKNPNIVLLPDSDWHIIDTTWVLDTATGFWVRKTDTALMKVMTRCKTEN